MSYSLKIFKVSENKPLTLPESSNLVCRTALVHVNSKLQFGLIVLLRPVLPDDPAENSIIDLDDKRVGDRYDQDVFAIVGFDTLERSLKYAETIGFSRAKCNIYNPLKEVFHQLSRTWQFFMPDSAKFNPTLENLAQLESCLLSWIHK